MMEPEEIAFVLTRASELHSKLSDAISFFVEDSSPPSSSRITGLQNGDGASELRSLAGIRDSLEFLEEQLESLQALQLQQRASRDASLAEIEESRLLFLKRLTEYRGRKLEIVLEALAFAGGTVPDKDEAPAQGGYSCLDEDGGPSHTRPVSIPRGWYGSEQEEQRSRNHMFGFEVDEAQHDDGSEIDSAFEDGEYRDPNSLIRAAAKAVWAMKASVMSSRAFTFVFNAVGRSVAFLGSFVGQISGQLRGPPSKVVLIVVSTLVVLSLTDLGERRTKSVARVSPAHRSRKHHIGTNANGERGPCTNSSKSYDHVKKPDPSKAMPAEGNNLASGAFPKCVVRERLELPFYHELQIPDVLHGRG